MRTTGTFYSKNELFCPVQPVCPACRRRQPAARDRSVYLSQPRFLKYHIGTSALATMSASAYG